MALQPLHRRDPQKLGPRKVNLVRRVQLEKFRSELS